MELLNKFFKSETGAITVDWVVLTAAVMGLSLAAIVLIEASLDSSGNTISNRIVAVVGQED